MRHFFTQGVAVGLGYIGLSARNATDDFKQKLSNFVRNIFSEKIKYQPPERVV
jgi:hypothetical protein